MGEFMRVKTEIGEIGVFDGERHYVFKPTFKNISNIGNPEDIIKIMRLLVGAEYMSNLSRLDFYNQLHKKDIFEAAENIINCCGDSGDLLGGYVGLKYKEGKMSYDDTVIIAAALIQAGTIGKPTKRQGQKKEDAKEFNVDDLVLMACKNLNISKKEAENLTLIQFQRALDLLYPVSEEKIAGTDVKSGDYDKSMAKAREMMQRSLNNG